MEKTNVNGKDTHELYKFLRSNSALYDPQKKVAKEIPWNYTKFLVSGDGKKVRYFNPREDPVKIIPFIEKFFETEAKKATDPKNEEEKKQNEF